MSRTLPKSIADLVESLRLLPGVGSRSAERYAYFLLKSDPSKAKKLSASLAGLHSGVGYCKKTFMFVEAGEEYSELYTDESRNKQTVLVVAEPFDVIAIENTRSYQGTYHVLGGLLSPIDGIDPQALKFAELAKRVEEDGVQEVIIATSASVEGESTAMYIQHILKPQDVTVSRLAQGLPIGVDIEYADQITLQKALEGRRELV